MSLRRVRSPDAPKITIATGSSVDGMASERIAQCRQQPVGERRLPSGAEAREERTGDHGRGHGLLHGILDRPASLARILHPCLEPVKLWILGERVCRQV